MKSWMGIAALAAAVTQPAGAQDIGALAWMAGNWVQKTAQEEVRENWLGPAAGMMVGVNLTATAGRGGSFEFIRIAAKDGRLVYFASPGGRPPVEFPLRESTATSVLFENPAHGYPARIGYRRDGEALVARIEGKRGGNEASEEWRFTRAP